VSFIYYEIVPLIFFEGAEANTDSFIGSETNIELSIDHLIPQYFVSNFHARVELHNTEEGSPFFEFLHPVRYAGLWCDHEMWPSHLLILVKVAQYGDRLYGFSQTLHRLSWLNSYHVIG